MTPGSALTSRSNEPLALARRIAAFGLPGHDGEAPPIRVPAESSDGLRACLHAQRLTGIATAGVEAGWLRLSEKHETEELLRSHRQAMLWALALERQLLVLASAFDETAIETVVLKGTATAHAFYPDPSWRSFADLDLLVRTRDWRRACALLTELGFRRELPEPRPGFDERFGKAATHVGRDGVRVDLHRTLVIGPFGLWLDPDDLFERTVRFGLGGRSLLRLDDTSSLLHACMHASLGSRPPLLVPLRDVLQIAWRGDVDWEALAELVRRWKLRAVIRHAFGEASAQLQAGLPEVAGRLIEMEPDARERRALEAYTTTRRRRGGTALSAIQAIPGLRGKISYVRALLVPDPEFLDVREDGRAHHYLHRWAIPIRWLGGKGRRA